MAVGGTIVIIACRDAGAPKSSSDREKISHYTCPMHPHIHADKPGECPICHMSLVPVYKDGNGSTDSAPTSDSKHEGPSVKISTERQQTIGITTEPVKRRGLTKVIRTVGEVAYDPILAVAQKEFVEIVKNIPSLKKGAISRLKLMGMSDEEIKALGEKRKTDSSLYLPSKGGPMWVYAPLYRHEVPLVETGQKATLGLLATQERLEGIVRGIEPILNDMTRSAKARIEIKAASEQIRPGVFLDTRIEIPLGEKIAVPKSAVINTGTRQIVFVVHDGTHFQSREVAVGTETEDYWTVESGLEEGEIIATSSVFMIDSEAQLKAAVAGSGGHQH